MPPLSALDGIRLEFDLIIRYDRRNLVDIPLRALRQSETYLDVFDDVLRIDVSYLDYRCKNPMDAGCPSGSTSSRRFPGGLIFLEAR